MAVMQCDDSSEWGWSNSRLEVVFHCVHYGQSYRVCISGEVITDNLEDGEPLDVAKKYSERIKNTATRLITEGKYDGDGKVIVTSRDLQQ